MRSLLLAVFVLAALPASARQAPPASAQAPGPLPAAKPATAERIDSAYVRASAGLDRLLPPRAESIYQALLKQFQPARAMEVVTFMDRYWRVAGNTGFNASLDHIKAGLLQAGFVEGKPAGESGPPLGGDSAPSAAAGLPRRNDRSPSAVGGSPRGTDRSPAGALWFEEYPNGGNGWEPLKAEMTIVESASGTTPEPVFDPVIDYIAICINSFSTPVGGVTAPLVYVGSGTDAANYAGVEVKGAVVLADAGMRRVWQEAVRNRGAIGVVSAAPMPAYTRPQESPEVFQWGGVPYDETARAFGFNASRRVADRLKEHVKAGPVKVKVDIDTKFEPNSPGRLLVAEIPGRTRPDERVVMVAHIQEPGSNDNASGCGTMLEMARALQAAIASKTIPAPARTLTFVWGDEMRASREWLRAEEARAKGTRYMISLDMTGEDSAKTGGTFLVEKEPDPSAVWPRPADPHTEWWGGRGFYKAEALKGSLLNDLYLAACLRRARDTGWVVQTNPYEGGSDHSIFLNAGIPAVLSTHFTDRYYHTNLDRPDKTSPAEMANVGIATGLTACLLASAGQDDALALVDLVAKAASTRLRIEERQSADFLAQAPDRTQAEGGERVLLEAWRAWYARALDSLLTLPAAPAGPRLRAEVKKAVAALGTGSR